MKVSDSNTTIDDSSIQISVARLLALRHLPSPAHRKTPASNSAWLGAFTSQKQGQGTDYDDLRPYSAGDDIRHVDWRASARTQELYTRLYREEKDYRITLICDLRQSMYTGSVRLRANRAAILSARLLWQACHGGACVTLVVITPTGISMVAPGSGHAAGIRGCNLLAVEHQHIAQQLAKRNVLHVRSSGKKYPRVTVPSKAPTVDANAMASKAQNRRYSLPLSNTEHGPTLDAVLQWALTQSERRTTRIWVSGFDYTGEHFFNTLSTASKYTANLAIQIDDPILSNCLPVGRFAYRTHTMAQGKPQTTCINTQVHKQNQDKLEQALTQTRLARTECFNELKIPYLTAANGDDEVISALRHGAYLV